MIFQKNDLVSHSGNMKIFINHFPALDIWNKKKCNVRKSVSLAILIRTNSLLQFDPIYIHCIFVCVHIFLKCILRPDVLTLRVNSHIWSNLHIYICLCTHISEVYVTTRRLNTTCKFAQIVYYNLIQFTYIYIYMCVCVCVYI